LIGHSGFKGAKNTLPPKLPDKNPRWSDVGIQINVAETASILNSFSPKTPFYAMYNLSTTLFSPVPSHH
jgi:hypothetical protein